MKNTLPLLLLLLFPIFLFASGSDTYSADTLNIQPLDNGTGSFQIEPLTTHTLPAKTGIITPVGSQHVNENDIIRARVLRGGGITLVCIGATTIAVPGTIFTIFGIVDHPVFLLPAAGFAAGGSGIIVGGAALIRKGNSIDGPKAEMALTPIINPFEDSYGAVFTVRF